MRLTPMDSSCRGACDVCIREGACTQAQEQVCILVFHVSQARRAYDLCSSGAQGTHGVTPLDLPYSEMVVNGEW